MSISELKPMTLECPQCESRFQFSAEKGDAKPEFCKQCHDYNEGRKVYTHPRWLGLNADVPWERNLDQYPFTIPVKKSQHAVAYILVKKEAAIKMQLNWKSTDSKAREDGFSHLTFIEPSNARYFCICDTDGPTGETGGPTGETGELHCHGWFDVGQGHEPQQKCMRIHQSLSKTPKPSITVCADGKTSIQTVEKRSCNFYNGHSNMIRNLAEKYPDYLLVGVKYQVKKGDDFQTFISESSNPDETPFDTLKRGLSEEVQITMTEESLRKTVVETGQFDFSRRHKSNLNVYFVIRIDSQDDYECITRPEVHEKVGSESRTNNASEPGLKTGGGSSASGGGSGSYVPPNSRSSYPKQPCGGGGSGSYVPPNSRSSYPKQPYGGGGSASATNVCTFFKRTGRCDYGNNCKFSHT
jgi:hypothetical protein